MPSLLGQALLEQERERDILKRLRPVVPADTCETDALPDTWPVSPKGHFKVKLLEEEEAREQSRLAFLPDPHASPKTWSFWVDAHWRSPPPDNFEPELPKDNLPRGAFSVVYQRRDRARSYDTVREFRRDCFVTRRDEESSAGCAAVAEALSIALDNLGRKALWDHSPDTKEELEHGGRIRVPKQAPKKINVFLDNFMLLKYLKRCLRKPIVPEDECARDIGRLIGRLGKCGVKTNLCWAPSVDDRILPLVWNGVRKAMEINGNKEHEEAVKPVLRGHVTVALEQDIVILRQQRSNSNDGKDYEMRGRAGRMDIVLELEKEDSQCCDRLCESGAGGGAGSFTLRPTRSDSCDGSVLGSEEGPSKT